MVPNIPSIQVQPKCTKTLKKRDICKFVEECPNCQQVKVEHLNLGGLTQTIEIRMWKWEGINMDFVVGLLKTTFKAEDYAKLYIDEIVRWHGISLCIISDRGAQFTSDSWKYF